MKGGDTPLRYAARMGHPEVVRLLLKSRDAENDAESKKAVCALPGCGLRCRAENPRKALMRCAGCRIAMYCGLAHQNDDWQRHKAECRAAAAAVADPSSGGAAGSSD